MPMLGVHKAIKISPQKKRGLDAQKAARLLWRALNVWISMTNLEKLQAWYLSQCNDDWEHQFGIKVDTLDNPGWKLEIDIEGTELEGKEFEEFQSDYESETNWIHCQVKDKKFTGASGPLMLENMIAIFLNWQDSI